MKSVPKHLERYVVEQNYDRYTAEDQAVWRYTMRQLKNFLLENAHYCYEDGLERTGLSTKEIPRIEEMNTKLQEFGWGAVPVSGFIPPAAFMEFQAHGFLPIASDMRSIDHILYTPAPDIVHEAAGHAPILVNRSFSKYLRAYAEIANKAIISHEDLSLYEAIRSLSDVKENPDSTDEAIETCEQNLSHTVQSMSFVSEASLLGRMNWWTAEYGLVGDLENPKIFGAGLLSSIGESKECLGGKVRKIPLSVDCVDFGYDITEPQPQLFVASDFDALTGVLEDLADKMAFRKGGLYGLQTALTAQTINTVELETGLQISGRVSEYLDHEGEAFFVKFDTPVQLCFQGREIEGHGKDYHNHGYSTPLGPLAEDQNFSELKQAETYTLQYQSGVTVNGRVKSFIEMSGQRLLVCFEQCEVSYKGQILFDRTWGDFDLAIGQHIQSVFGGPADRPAYGDYESFVAQRVPERALSAEKESIFKFYQQIRRCRESQPSQSLGEVKALIEKYLADGSDQWLIGVELLELCHLTQIDASVRSPLESHLKQLMDEDPLNNQCISDGIKLAAVHDL